MNLFKNFNYLLINDKFITYILCVCSLLICLELQGCAAVAVSGAATGVAMASDRRTTGTIIDDQAIEVKATHALAKNKELWKNSHISVISYNNDLLLVGQTPSEGYKQQAEEAVKNISKIRKIYNELSLAEPASLTTRSEDAWITTQIKAKMISNRTINPTRVKVITENGVVFLMGITSPEEQAIATEIASSVNGVNKVVQIFETT